MHHFKLNTLESHWTMQSLLLSYCPKVLLITIILFFLRLGIYKVKYWDFSASLHIWPKCSLSNGEEKSVQKMSCVSP